MRPDVIDIAGEAEPGKGGELGTLRIGDAPDPLHRCSDTGASHLRQDVGGEPVESIAIGEPGGAAHEDAAGTCAIA